MSSTVETDESKPSNSGYPPTSLSTPGKEPYSPQFDSPSTNISSTLGLTNAIKIQDPAWAKLKSSLCDLRDNSSEFAEFASATCILLECLDGIEKAARNQKDYISLAEELNTRVGVLVQYIKASMSSTDDIFNITTQIKQQAEEIKKMINSGPIRWLVMVDKDKDVVDSYKKVISLFGLLQEILNSIRNDGSMDVRLEVLNPVEHAAYDSSFLAGFRRGCIEGTRINVLSDLERWQCDPEGPAVYWMSGMAGTGKTTIAYTLSEILERCKQLGATFFCTRNIPSCRNVTRIIPTIAYQLACNFAPFRFALSRVLTNEPELASLVIREQFEQLLRDPLREARHIMPNSLVIVIDALDECKDCSGVETLLDILFRYTNDLRVRFFLTSRPEPEIYSCMMQDANARVIHLHQIERSLIDADLKLYLIEELSFMSPAHLQVEQLVQHSGSRFIYAETLSPRWHMHWTSGGS